MSRLARVPKNFLASSSNPTGPTLVVGDTYYNTSSKTLRIYDGSAWVDLLNDETTQNVSGIKNFQSYVVVPAAGAASPSLRMPHGSAPSSPSDGDLWTTTAGLYARINGSTVGPFGTGGSGSPATTVTTLDGLQSAVVGTATNYAREDHKHAVTNLVDLASAQTLVGSKTFQGTFPNTNVYIKNPASGTSYVWFKDSSDTTVGNISVTDTHSSMTLGKAGSENSSLILHNKFGLGGIFFYSADSTSGVTTSSPGKLIFETNYWTGSNNVVNVNFEVEQLAASAGNTRLRIVGQDNLLVINPTQVYTTNASDTVRWVGGRASAAPTAGTWAVGDWVVAQNGKIFVCTTAGTPGTWTEVGSGGSSPLTTKGDLYTYTTTGARLAVGATNGMTLVVDSAESAGIKWLSVETPLVLSRAGTLTTGTGVSRVGVEGSYTIAGVRARCNTAPTGASILVDVNKNGTTIFTTQGNRPSIAASANASSYVTNMDVTTLASGDYLTVDVDQIGSTVAGADLTVTVWLRKTS